MYIVSDIQVFRFSQEELQWIDDGGVRRIDISIAKIATETNDDDSSRELEVNVIKKVLL